MLVDLGHHAQGVNIEQIVALLDDEGRLGGFHFNNRKYADDDLIVGSVNPFELFLIFFELAAGAALPRLHDRPVPQRRGEGRGDGADASSTSRRPTRRRCSSTATRCARAQQAGDVLGGHEVLLDAYRTDVRPLCARVRAALGAAEDPVAALRAAGYARAHGRRARHDRRRPEAGTRVTRHAPDRPASTDLWPDAEPPADALDAARATPRTCSARTARSSNFGGGNTSAKGARRPTTRAARSPCMWVKGSGSDLATMGAGHFTGLKLDEVLPLIERDEMSDEEMVAYLARCQLDPATPRCSIETLLHAFVPAPHVHHTHPDGINVLAGSADGERARAECFGDAAAWIPYIRPGFTLVASRSARRRAPTRTCKLVVLAKHGLVVWGDSAEEAYRRTIEVINQAVAFVNERTGDAPRFGGATPAARPRPRRRSCCTSCCRRSAARSRASGASC